MALGDRIRQRREELGWTQEALATRAGLSKGFVSDLEHGKRGIGAQSLLDVAQVLGMSLDYLMKGSEEAPTPQEIEIPSKLAEFAKAAELTFRKTLLLLDMQRQIIAHRTSGKRDDDLEAVDWRKFYESVKDFL
jgi:transcriptional regulator with XRE-family HTH domain